VAYSITNHDCSRGDLDFLCRNADACSDFLPRADAEILCAALQDGPTMPTLRTEIPTLPTENPSLNPRFSTGVVTRSFVTGTNRRVVTGYAMLGPQNQSLRLSKEKMQILMPLRQDSEVHLKSSPLPETSL